MLIEPSKAATAVAETTGKVIDGLRELGGFLGKIRSHRALKIATDSASQFNCGLGIPRELRITKYYP